VQNLGDGGRRPLRFAVKFKIRFGSNGALHETSRDRRVMLNRTRKTGGMQRKIRARKAPAPEKFMFSVHVAALRGLLLGF